MNHKERMLAAIRLQEADKVPRGEEMIHDVLVTRLVGDPIPGEEENALYRWMFEPLSDREFERHKRARDILGFDWLMVFPRTLNQLVGESGKGHKVYRDSWGIVTEVGDETMTILETPINSPADLGKYEFPQVEQFAFDNVLRWIHDCTFYVCPQLDTGFFFVSQLVGFERYMHFIFDCPRELHGFMGKFAEFQIRMADHLLDLGSDCVYLSDDHAYNSGPFLSPEHLWEFDFQYLKRIVEHVHSRGKPCLLHSCGNLEHTIEPLIETGIDALHGFQPTAHNEIIEQKQKYGDRLCLMGNLDVNYLMPHGTPYEIDQAVKELVHGVGHGGGLVVSTCNLLDADVPPENALAMHLAVEKYGRYPLPVDAENSVPT